MNTHGYLVLLMAIGLSAQKTEFEIDFQNMLDTVKLKDNKTLLSCKENCSEVEEIECKCVHFDHCSNSTVLECFKKGLEKLNFTQQSIDKVYKRLQRLQTRLLKNLTQEDKWNKPVSPKLFLNNLMNFAQQLKTLLA